jgi:hypothetical protein
MRHNILCSATPKTTPMMKLIGPMIITIVLGNTILSIANFLAGNAKQPDRFNPIESDRLFRICPIKKLHPSGG